MRVLSTLISASAMTAAGAVVGGRSLADAASSKPPTILEIATSNKDPEIQHESLSSLGPSKKAASAVGSSNEIAGGSTATSNKAPKTLHESLSSSNEIAPSINTKLKNSFKGKGKHVIIATIVALAAGGVLGGVLGHNKKRKEALNADSNGPLDAQSARI